MNVEGDSKLLVDNTNLEITCSWRIQTTVEDIRRFIPILHISTFQHIKREQNFVADAITKIGHTTNSGLALLSASVS